MDLKELTQTRDPKFGTFLFEFTTPGIGYILKAAGCDFVVIDLEHSGIGVETTKHLLRYLEAADLPAIVGLPAKDNHFISRTQDIGAEGVMPPMVASADEVRRMVRHLKFPPLGERAVSVQVGHDRYAPAPVDRMLADTNARSVFFAKVETADAIGDIDRIAAEPGVDGLWVGHYDLTASLGIPGQFDSPMFTDAIDAVVAACRANNLALGRIASSIDEGKALIDVGFDFIAYSGDAWILRDALGTAITSLRQAVKES
ncbi:MAG: hpch/hpai aldolase [Planctomycetaceae bacterium]|nr:hpch/hpai aldolase [Planctomycetaceae bacterium]